MFDFLSPKWSIEGIDLGVSDKEFEAGGIDLERRLASKEVSFGEKFPASGAEMVHHTRWNLMRYILKAPVFVGHFTGINGLGKRLASFEATAEEVVPSESRTLVVLDFDNLTAELPPLFVIHRLADTAVPFADSDKLVEKTKALGNSAKYWRLEGLDHDFGMEFPDLEDAESVKVEDASTGKQAVRELLQGLDSVLDFHE